MDRLVALISGLKTCNIPLYVFIVCSFAYIDLLTLKSRMH